MSLFDIHLHGFSLVIFIQHLFLDGLATGGGYYARSFCEHWYHRVAIGVAIWIVSTVLLVTLVG